MQTLRQNPPAQREVMVDRHGRLMRKLRLSLLDACNLRCLYCMPERPQFLPRDDWASVADLARITANLVDMGIEEVRLTGGEPTLRADLPELLEKLAPLPLKSFGITSNALLIGPLLPALKQSGCTALNISLDSLSEEGFRRMTRRGGLKTVLANIDRAQELGFHIKVNMVVMRGLNDHEVEDFARWAAATGVEVRFLEVMNIGVMRQWFEARFVSADEIEQRLREHWALEPVPVSRDSTAYRYRLDNGARIGFIASQSRPFCMGCSRLRLSPKGHIRPCLFRDDGIDLKPLPKDQYAAALRAVIAMKPTARIRDIAQPMHQIGG